MSKRGKLFRFIYNCLFLNDHQKIACTCVGQPNECVLTPSRSSDVFWSRFVHAFVGHRAGLCRRLCIYKCNEIMCFFQDVVVPLEPSSGYLSVCQSAPSSIVLIILVCKTLGLILIKYLFL